MGRDDFKMLIYIAMAFLVIGFLLMKKNRILSAIFLVIGSILNLLSLSLPFLMAFIGFVLMVIGFKLNPKYAEKSIKIFQLMFAISVLITIIKAYTFILLLMFYSILMVIYLNTLVKKKRANNFEGDILPSLNHRFKEGASNGMELRNYVPFIVPDSTTKLAFCKEGRGSMSTGV